MSASRKLILGALIALLGGLAAIGAENTNTVLVAAAEGTNALLCGGSATPAPAPASTPGFDAGASFVRVFGALLVVLAIFFGAVWFYRNWQRVVGRSKGGVRLNVMEVRSLGNKQSLVVIGYGPQRMLVGATPSGISMLTHLPAEESSETSGDAEAPALPSTAPSFMEALRQVVARKGS
jgi:flagellar protein FliO/FliZ